MLTVTGATNTSFSQAHLWADFVRVGRAVDRWWSPWYDRTDRMIESREAAERQRRICEDFDQRQKDSRREAIRAVVESTQRLSEAAPEAVQFIFHTGTGKTNTLLTLVTSVRSNRLQLNLDHAQRVLFDRWADATLAALAYGVDEGVLHALLARYARGLGCYTVVPRQFRRALSRQLHRLEHSIARHAPPQLRHAGPREAHLFPAEVTATA